jgi:hypothetical protein
MPFVLDASIAEYWAFDDEDHPVAPLALERIRTDEARVRRLWWFEVRNAITVSERRGRLTESHTATFPHGLRICASPLIGRRRRPILALAATAALQTPWGNSPAPHGACELEHVLIATQKERAASRRPFAEVWRRRGDQIANARPFVFRRKAA